MGFVIVGVRWRNFLVKSGQIIRLDARRRVGKDSCFLGLIQVLPYKSTASLYYPFFVNFTYE